MDIILDKQADFGQVIPPLPIRDPQTGAETGHVAHFEQNGFLFDFHGNVIEASMSEKDHSRARRLAAQRKADLAAEKARREVLADFELAPEDFEAAPAPSTAKPVVETVAKFDLAAWRRKEVHVPFGVVKKAIRDQLSIVVDTAEQAREAIDENMSEIAGA